MKEKEVQDLCLVWRQLFVFSDLLRAVAKGDADATWMNRVSVNQARIFGYILSRPDESIHLNKLARDLSVSPAAASQAIDRLVKAGHVTREQDPTDRRAILIRCTAQGASLYYEVRERTLPVLERALGKASEEDAAAFVRVLGLLFGDVEARWHEILSKRDEASRADDEPFQQTKTKKSK